MNKLWVFGDSYSTINREKRENKDEYRSLYTDVAKHLGLVEENNSLSGLSSFDIKVNILKFLNEFKEGDYLFYQLSIPDRFSYTDFIKDREFNDKEKDLLSIGSQFYTHPQYYPYNKKLTDIFLSNVSSYIDGFHKNLFDFYYKLFVDIKYIFKFLESKGVNPKIILLENKKMLYDDGIENDIINILKDLDISEKIVTFGKNINCIKDSPLYKEEGTEYDYHHFSLETLKKFSKIIIDNNF